MTGYALWVGLGVAAAAVAARWQPATPGVAPAQRPVLALAALGGAILGAYFLELPADLWGWHAPPPPWLSVVSDGAPLGGRTVLGGLLGGWLAVEAIKRPLGIRAPTGDGFALPLAVALAFGRLGCIAAGCCAGVECAPGPLAALDAAGTPRVPVQAIEAAFHAGAAILLAVAARRNALPGRRLACYLAAYAALRFVLERWRPHPVVALGMTWYQLLALGLFALAGGTWVARRSAVAASSRRT